MILRKLVCIALAAALAAPVQSQLSSGIESGDAAAGEMTPSRERKIGEQIMQDIRRDPDYLNDPLLEDYIAGIADRLVSASTQSGQTRVRIETFVVRDKAINAFALPGGFLGFHTQLIASAKSEDELASVVAHEIAHVSQRHIARMTAKEQQNALLGLGSVLLAAIVAARNPEAAQAAVAFGQAGAISQQLSFNRDMEREADRIGMNALVAAGYEPPAMLNFFKTLQAASQLSDSQQFPYLRTHPLTSERISEVQQRLEARDLSAATQVVPSLISKTASSMSHVAPPKSERQMQFALMSARAKIAGITKPDAYVAAKNSCAAQQRLSDPLAVAGGQYCEALASAKLRDAASAKRASAELGKALANRGGVLKQYSDLLQAEVLLAAGQAQEAAALLLELKRSMPFSRARSFLLAEAAVESRAESRADVLNEAREGLQALTAAHREDRQAWVLLGQVFNARGEPGPALRATAESAVLDRDWLRAAAMLQQAQPLVRGDYVESSIVDTRLREVRQLLAESKEGAKRR